MSIEILEMEQGSPAWVAARLGTPSASQFKAILAKGEGKTRATYMRKLAGELLCGEQMDSFTSKDMEHGKLVEAEARELYGFLNPSLEMTQVGFVKNGIAGASPDCFLNNDGILELKREAPHLLIDTIISDNFPSEHKAQTQGNLWVCEREWVEIAIYYPKMPLFTKKAPRDEVYIRNLASEVERFRDELHELVAKIKAYGMAA